MSVAWICALALVAAACGKAKVLNHSSDETDSNGGGSGSGSGGAGPGLNAGSAGVDWQSLNSVPGDLRRLTAAEYTATVTDVLGTATQPDLGAFSTLVDGFDNNAAANGVSDALYLRYLETAEALADEVFASDTLRPLIVTCALVDDTVCVRQIISQTGLRLFRRPLLDDEVTGYQKAYGRARARGENHEGAVKEALIALLASAQFLFRMEFVPTHAGTQPVSPYDLAARLSYLLWSSAPDSKLLDAAQQGALATDDQLVATVTRLLADGKSARFAQNFAGQWLGARSLATLSLDPMAFPQWTPELAGAAATEIQAYFAEFLHQDEDWLGFLDSRAHFVNTKLGSLYGLTVAGPVTQRVELSDVDRRGFLGLVGFLAQTSAGARSSPSTRGAWIQQQLLCAQLPETPADMPAFSGAEASIRGYLEGLNAQPTCKACHAQLDPLGLALENYDAVGQYRTMYAGGAAIDAKVMLPAAIASAGSVSGIAGVSAALASSPAFTACVAQKLYTYGLGRAFAAAEQPNVQALAQQWRSGPLTMRELVLRLVQSPAFRSRSDGGTL